MWFKNLFKRKLINLDNSKIIKEEKIFIDAISQNNATNLANYFIFSSTLNQYLIGMVLKQLGFKDNEIYFNNELPYELKDNIRIYHLNESIFDNSFDLTKLQFNKSTDKVINDIRIFNATSLNPILYLQSSETICEITFDYKEEQFFMVINQQKITLDEIHTFSQFDNFLKEFLDTLFFFSDFSYDVIQEIKLQEWNKIFWNTLKIKEQQNLRIYPKTEIFY